MAMETTFTIKGESDEGVQAIRDLGKSFADVAKKSAAQVQAWTDYVKANRAEIKKSIEEWKKWGAEQVETAKRAAVGITAATAAITALTIATAHNDEAMGDLAARTGQTVEEVSRLDFVASKFGNTGQELQTGFKDLALKMREATRGTGEAAEAFRDLGIPIEQLTGPDGALISSNEAFKLISDRFASMPDGAQKTALAMKVMGESALNLVPLMNSGSKEIERLEKMSDRLGFTVTASAAAIGTEFSHNLRIATRMAAEFGKGIGRLLIPGFNQITKAAIEAGTAMLEGMRWRDVGLQVQGVAEGLALMVDLTNAAASPFLLLGDVLQRLVLGSVSLLLDKLGSLSGLMGNLWEMAARGADAVGAKGLARSFREVANEQEFFRDGLQSTAGDIDKLSSGISAVAWSGTRLSAGLRMIGDEAASAGVRMDEARGTGVEMADQIRQELEGGTTPALEDAAETVDTATDAMMALGDAGGAALADDIPAAAAVAEKAIEGIVSRTRVATDAMRRMAAGASFDAARAARATAGSGSSRSPLSGISVTGGVDASNYDAQYQAVAQIAGVGPEELGRLAIGYGSASSGQRINEVQNRIREAQVAQERARLEELINPGLAEARAAADRAASDAASRSASSLDRLAGVAERLSGVIGGVSQTPNATAAYNSAAAFRLLSRGGERPLS